MTFGEAKTGQVFTYLPPDVASTVYMKVSKRQYVILKSYVREHVGKIYLWRDVYMPVYPIKLRPSHISKKWTRLRDLKIGDCYTIEGNIVAIRSRKGAYNIWERGNPSDPWVGMYLSYPKSVNFQVHIVSMRVI